MAIQFASRFRYPLSARRRARAARRRGALAVLIVAGSLAAAIAWPRPRAKEPAPRGRGRRRSAGPRRRGRRGRGASDEPRHPRPPTYPPRDRMRPRSRRATPPRIRRSRRHRPRRRRPPSGRATPRRGPVALDTLSEEELRQRLASATEVGLSPAELPPLVNSWAANFATDFETRGDVSFGPAVLLGTRPDLAALPIRYGRASRIGGTAAAELQRLSKRLHALLDLTAPTDGQGRRADLAVLRQLLRGENLGRKPLWLRAEAIPTLSQILMHEGEPVRALLVELLADIDGRAATVAPAQRAVFDLSADVRRQAVEALRRRPRADARATFLDALRYPGRRRPSTPPKRWWPWPTATACPSW